MRLVNTQIEVRWWEMLQAGIGFREARALTALGLSRQLVIPFKAANASEVVGAILTAIHEISEGNIGQSPPPPPSTIEVIRDEILWLLGVLDTADIQPGVKNALRTKLENTLPHIDKALACEDACDDKGVKTALQPCLGMLRAFVNQVEAQYDKKVSQPDAGIFIERVNALLDKIAEICAIYQSSDSAHYGAAPTS